MWTFYKIYVSDSSIASEKKNTEKIWLIKEGESWSSWCAHIAEQKVQGLLCLLFGMDYHRCQLTDDSSVNNYFQNLSVTDQKLTTKKNIHKHTQDRNAEIWVYRNQFS